MRLQTSTTLFAAAFCLGAFAASSTTAQAADKDQAYANRLLGKWSLRLFGEDNTVEYKKDGTYLAKGHIPSPKKPIAYHHSGSWKIEKGVIHTEVTGSSDKGLIPVGMKQSATILKLDDQILQTRENGSVIAMKRVK